MAFSGNDLPAFMVDGYAHPLLADYGRAAQVLVRSLKIVFGSSADVRPIAELQTQIELPDVWTADRLGPRLVGNSLLFRANYGRALAAWAAVCAVRHPIGALWLLVISTASFHALLVRRGVVHFALPGRQPKTLMYPLLHVLLAVGSMLAVLLVGRLSFIAAMLLPPVLLAAAHAIVRVPPTRVESEQRAAQVAIELRAALRGDEADADELEMGAADEEPPARSEELAKRVEQIRAKYRPPASKRSD